MASLGTLTGCILPAGDCHLVAGPGQQLLQGLDVLLAARPKASDM